MIILIKKFNFYFLIVLSFSLILVSCSLSPVSENKISSQKEEKLIISEGVLFENFEDIHEWKPETVNSILQTDQEFKKEGSQGLKITSSNNNSSYSYKLLDSNISLKRNIIFWVYIHELENLEDISIYFSSTENWSRHLSKTIDAGSLNEGWNRMLIAKSEFKSINEEVWDNITRIKIGCKSKPKKEVSVTFDDFRYNYQAKAIIIIAFDDGFNSVFTNAYPILGSNGFRASLFVITGRIGNKPYLSMFKLKILKFEGWDICNHSKHHEKLTEIDQAGIEKEINDSYNWLANNGFKNTACFFAYPFGEYDNEIINEVKENHKLGHSTIDGYYQPHIQLDENSDIQYLLKVKNIIDKTTVENIKERIDLTIEKNGLLILLFHQIVEKTGEEDSEFSISKFQQVIDYLREKQNTGKLEVITLSQYYQLISQEK